MTEDGKQAYASKIIENTGTVQDQKYNLKSDQKKKVAESLLKGFAADVLIANWDVVGLGLDNIMTTPKGDVLIMELHSFIERWDPRSLRQRYRVLVSGRGS